MYNPATGEQTHEVDFASVAEVDAAVEAAREAFPRGAPRRCPSARTSCSASASSVDDHRADMAALLTAQHGKVLSDAMGEVARGIENVEFACGIPHLLKGGFTEQASTGVDVYSIRQPLGVVAGITPFNFPAMVPMWMFASAIACGNTFILKPVEKDPGASLYVAELLKDAGLPDGVFNVVQGDKVVVDRLLEHPDVEAVSFVGLDADRAYIYETGTANGKRVQALGGAKNHMVVLPDADIDMAADAAVSAAYGSAGERCMAISVVVAVGDVGDTLVEAIKERLPTVRIGNGHEPESEMGPLVTREHRDKVAGYLDSAEAQGATIVEDGREHELYRRARWLLPRGVADRPRDDGHGRLQATRSSGPCWRWCGRTLRRSARVGEREPVRERDRDLHARRRRGARSSSSTSRRAWWASTCPSPCRWATTRSAGGRSRCSATAHMYGPEGVNFYTRGKVVTARWPDPGTSSVDLGFPRTR